MKQKRGSSIIPIIALLVLALIFLTVMLVYQIGGREKPGMVVSIQVNNGGHIVFLDETLDITTRVVPRKIAEVSLRYEITKINNPQPLWSKEISTGLKDQQSTVFEEQIGVSSFPVGTYRLRVTASGNEVERSAFSTFFVKKPKADPLPVEPSPSTPPPPSLSPPPPPFEPDSPTSQTKTLTVHDILIIGDQDAEKGEQLCKELVTMDKKDKCISSLAKRTKNSLLCSQVEDVAVKDGCLGTLALGGEFELCKEITDEHQKEVCEAIARYKQQ